jgi:hypothetical protein
MPKRKRIQRVDTEAVQGEGSYVVIKRMLVGEIRSMAKRATGDMKLLAVEMSSEILATHVVEWNWVDDEDNPLPVPYQNEEVFDQLSDEEFQFLSELMMGIKNRKN